MITNPFLFIVGCPRSGTTLLQRVVDAHPQIAITPETHWVARWFEKRKGMTPEGFVKPKLIPKLVRHGRCARMQIGKEQLERLLGTGEPVFYSNFVTGIFDLYGEAQGKQLVGDKTPGYVRKLKTLHELWPSAKFVHLIRDGRDVCLSMAQWEKAHRSAGRFSSWTDDSVVTTALYWEWHVRWGREAGPALGSDLYYEIRYEDFVARPADECAALCSFLGVPFDDAMLGFHEGRTTRAPGLSTKDQWLPITPGLRNWKTEMSARDTARFELSAGRLIDELAYPRTGQHPPGRVEEIARIRDMFSNDVRSLGEALPASW